MDANLLARAKGILKAAQEKRAYVPMNASGATMPPPPAPGGGPPMAGMPQAGMPGVPPPQAAGPAPGGMPADPSMGGAPPMDPSMAGGAPPMDPSMGGGGGAPGGMDPSQPIVMTAGDLIQFFQAIAGGGGDPNAAAAAGGAAPAAGAVPAAGGAPAEAAKPKSGGGAGKASDGKLDVIAGKLDQLVNLQMVALQNMGAAMKPPADSAPADTGAPKTASVYCPPDLGLVPLGEASNQEILDPLMPESPMVVQAREEEKRAEAKPAETKQASAGPSRLQRIVQNIRRTR